MGENERHAFVGVLCRVPERILDGKTHLPHLPERRHAVLDGHDHRRGCDRGDLDYGRDCCRNQAWQPTIERGYSFLFLDSSLSDIDANSASSPYNL